ncbi:MAG: glycosyltransferase family 4 protein [Desulfobulbus sp.]
MAYFVTLLLSMYSTIALVPLLISAAATLKMIDQPGGRKVHTSPIPRVGGLAMILGAIPPVCLYTHLDHFSVVVLAGSAILVLFAVLDDSIGLGYKTKFAGQIIAATIVVGWGGLSVPSSAILPEAILAQPWIAYPLTLLVIVAVTNAVNLADGLDGLAGGMMALVFICLALLAGRSDAMFIAILSMAMVGAILGFLRFNTFPALVFMGDAGSQLLGFLGIVLTLALTQKATTALSPLLPLLLFGFPVLDMAMVMFERIRRGVSPFRGDQNHFHHKLIRMGLSHAEAVLLLYAIQAVFVILACLFRFSSDWTVLGAFCVAACLLPVPVYVLYGRGFQLRRKQQKAEAGCETDADAGLVKKKILALRVSQGLIEYGLPALFLGAACLPCVVGPITGIVGLLVLGVLLASCGFKGSWSSVPLRMTVYLLLPLMFAHCRHSIGTWVSSVPFGLYAGCYGLVFFAAIAVLKLTRRQKGFRLTPTDFLIVFIVLLLFNLLGPVMDSGQLGMWVVLLIVFFFAFELLIGELRGEIVKLKIALVPGLVVLIARSGLWEALQRWLL